MTALGKNSTKPVNPEPHEHLDQILDRPEFNYWKLRQERAKSKVKFELLESLLQTFKEMIKSFFEWLGKLLRSLAPKRSLPEMNFKPANIVWLMELAGWIALAVILPFLAVLLFRLAREGKFSGRAVKILSREQVREALESGEALALDGPEWLKEAERLAAEREFRGVFRAIYLALLSGLHAAGKIDFSKNRTNWTYVMRFHGNDVERDVFSKLTGIFDMVWYGFKEYGEYSIVDLKREVVMLLKMEN